MQEIQAYWVTSVTSMETEQRFHLSLKQRLVTDPRRRHITPGLIQKSSSKSHREVNALQQIPQRTLCQHPYGSATGVDQSPKALPKFSSRTV